MFEDVTLHGYGLSSGPLNVDGAKFVAGKLAKFHAASVYLDRDVRFEKPFAIMYKAYWFLQGKGVQYYENGLFNLKSRDGVNFMKNNMTLFIEEIKTWDGFEMIADKMENLEAKFEASGIKVYQSNGAEGYCVLNHGDFHYNNMVFKKDSEGKLSDVLFVSYISVS